jgi:hypothetical protein
LGGFFQLFGNFTKKGFFAKMSSIYSESAQKTLPEKVHYFDLWRIRGNLGEKVEWSGIHKKTFISNFFIF